jgi:FkbM family methyltransferase
MPTFHLRPNTSDAYIFRSVAVRNEYRLPTSFLSSDVVIDIGAHIGAFAVACLLRNVGKVYAVEPVLANVDLLHENLNPFKDRIQVMHGAAWRSDGLGPQEVCYEDCPRSPGIPNTGGTEVVCGRGEHRVKAVQLDRLIDEACEAERTRIRLLKVDAECSEWPILLTSKSLTLVDSIVGEFHEMGGAYDTHMVPFRSGRHTSFTADLLRRFLLEQGFASVVTDRKRRREDGKPSNCGLFFSHRLTHTGGIQ